MAGRIRERFIFRPGVPPQAWQFLYHIGSVPGQRNSGLLISGHSKVLDWRYLAAAHYVWCSECTIVCMSGIDGYGTRKPACCTS